MNCAMYVRQILWGTQNHIYPKLVVECSAEESGPVASARSRLRRGGKVEDGQVEDVSGHVALIHWDLCHGLQRTSRE